MLKQRIFVLSAVLLTLVLPCAADEFEGARWTVPYALKPSQISHHCPARCYVYEGRSEPVGAEGPYVIVHEPFAGNLDAFYEVWSRNAAQAKGAPIELIERTKHDIDGVDDLTVITAYTESEASAYGGRDAAVLMMFPQGNTLVAVEISALNLTDAQSKFEVAGQIIDTLQFDARKIKPTIKPRPSTNPADAVEAGYLRGLQAKLYLRQEASQRKARELTMYAFLPGNVVFTGFPNNFRKPDFDEQATREVLGTWRAARDGVIVNLPNGRRAGMTFSEERELLDGDEKFPFIHPLSSNEIVGRYERLEDMPLTEDGAVEQEGDEPERVTEYLELLVDGKFSIDRGRYLSLSDVIGSGEAAQGARMLGNWEYDFASYTLTLTPHDGTPALSGPFFCYTCTSATVSSGTWEWNVMGDAAWQRLNRR